MDILLSDIPQNNYDGNPQEGPETSDHSLRNDSSSSATQVNVHSSMSSPPTSSPLPAPDIVIATKNTHQLDTNLERNPDNEIPELKGEPDKISPADSTKDSKATATKKLERQKSPAKRSQQKAADHDSPPPSGMREYDLKAEQEIGRKNHNIKSAVDVHRGEEIPSSKNEPLIRTKSGKSKTLTPVRTDRALQQRKLQKAVDGKVQPQCHEGEDNSNSSTKLKSALRPKQIGRTTTEGEEPTINAESENNHINQRTQMSRSALSVKKSFVKPQESKERGPLHGNQQCVAEKPLAKHSGSSRNSASIQYNKTDHELQRNDAKPIEICYKNELDKKQIKKKLEKSGKGSIKASMNWAELAEGKSTKTMKYVKLEKK